MYLVSDTQTWPVPDPTRIQLKLNPYIRRVFVTRNLCQRWVEWEQVSSIPKSRFNEAQFNESHNLGDLGVLLKLATFWKKNVFSKTHCPSLKQAGRVLMSTKDVPKEQKSVVSSCGNFELVVFLMLLSK